MADPIVVRVTTPYTRYPVGAELGYRDVADATRILGAGNFVVVREQDGDPLTPPTPEELSEAERQALARAKAARIVRGAEFDAAIATKANASSLAAKADASAVAALTTRADAGLNRPNLVVSMGDSITSNSGTPPLQADRGYLTWASVLSNSRIRWGQPYASGGFRSDQIRATHLPQVIAATPRPGWCVVLAGANDVMQNRALALITADLAAMYETLVANGTRPALCTILPIDAATSAQRAVIAALNTFIARYAQDHGLPLIDLYAAVVDTATGNFRPGLASDGTHPTASGAKVMGQAIADVLAPLVTPSVTPLATDNGGHGLLLANPLMLTDSNSDGLPDNWSKIGTDAHTVSLVPGGSEAIGNWLQLDKTAGTGAVLLRSPAMTVTPGDRILVGFRAKAENLAGGGKVMVTVGKVTAPTTYILAPIYTWSIGFGTGSFVNEAIPVPAGLTSIQVEAQVLSGTGRLSLGQLTLRNLTALGLA